MEKFVFDPRTPVEPKSEQLGRFFDDEREECILVGRARNGDRKSFDALVRRCDRLILAFALSACSDRRTAPTVYVRTFVEAYRSIRRLPPGMRFRTWVYGIAQQVTSNGRFGRRI
jgi:hypothetical protein